MVKEKSDVAQTVYINNYDRAETDIHNMYTIAGGWLGRMWHVRNITQMVNNSQLQVVRVNRDTLYSSTAYDLTQPVTFEMPPTKGVYMSLYALDQDQYSIAMFYPDSWQTTTVTFTYIQQQKEQRRSGRVENGDVVVSGTRYIHVIIRTLVNPYDPVDLARGNALQDAVKITQASVGEFVIPSWDMISLTKVVYYPPPHKN